MFTLPTLRCLPLVVAVLGAGVHPLASQSHAQTALTMPDTVKSFTLRETKVYEEPERGALYRYISPESGTVDVFVYPTNDTTGTPELSTNSLLDRETEIFKHTIPIGIQRGWYDAVEPAYEKHDTIGNLIGREVAMAVRRGDESRISYFYLYVHQGNFVKVRATVPVPVFRAGTVPSFVRSLITRLSQPSSASRA